ncbi:MAG TPA: hypothetical protein PKW37_00610 [Salinivirgaceae bacterium]|nr:hypothetical protein [Salinivirgaceae bacterium]
MKRTQLTIFSKSKHDYKLCSFCLSSRQKKYKYVKHLLLILFLAYYSSITFFPHSHIVDGVTIVHSHPYNPFSEESPTKHNHQKSEYVLIQLLSYFVTTVSFGAILFVAIKVNFKDVIYPKNDEVFSNLHFFCSNGFRAPPLAVLN